MVEWIIVLLCLYPITTEAQTLVARPASLTRDWAMVQQTDSIRQAPPRPVIRDDWFGSDKGKHLMFSTLLTLSTQYLLVQKTDATEANALPLSIGTTALIGLGKEVYDRTRGHSHYFSRKDLVADAAGILIGVALIKL